MSKLKVYIYADGIEQTHHFNFGFLTKDELIRDIKRCSMAKDALTVSDIDGKILHINFDLIKTCYVIVTELPMM